MVQINIKKNFYHHKKKQINNKKKIIKLKINNLHRVLQVNLQIKNKNPPSDHILFKMIHLMINNLLKQSKNF
jgi:adenosyl cobinamide kinase/adenosyl cobinamide phosphate guanylyltransferase